MKENAFDTDILHVTFGSYRQMFLLLSNQSPKI